MAVVWDQGEETADFEWGFGFLVFPWSGADGAGVVVVFFFLVGDCS